MKKVNWLDKKEIKNQEIVLSMIVCIILGAGLGYSITMAQQPSIEHTWTKAMIVDDKLCDFYVECEGEKLINITFTGNCIPLEQWNGEELNKKWCG